jgi:hypothetical protein
MRDDDGLTDTGAYLLVAGFGVALVGLVSGLAWLLQKVLGGLGW